VAKIVDAPERLETKGFGMSSLDDAPVSDGALIAFVGVPELQPIHFSALARRVGEWVESSATAAAREQPNLGVINVEDRRFVILAMDFPVPPQDLGMAVRTAYAWCDAEAAFGEAKAQCVVSSLKAPSDGTQAIDISSGAGRPTRGVADANERARALCS
jgi:hypothetical protein